MKNRRENTSKYFFDLSKLTFAALSVGIRWSFFNIVIGRDYHMLILTFDHLVYFWSWLSCYRMVRIYWKFNT